jgi:hypothetical protein
MWDVLSGILIPSVVKSHMWCILPTFACLADRPGQYFTAVPGAVSISDPVLLPMAFAGMPGLKLSYG